MAGAQPADAVTHHNPVGAAGALDRPMMNRENDGLALPKRYDLAFRLRSPTIARASSARCGNGSLRPKWSPKTPD